MRKRLETAIEKETYKFLNMIKESASDTVMLWANRKRVDMDMGLLQAILDQYKTAIESECMGKMDHFMRGLDKELGKFTETENPFPPTAKPKAPRKNAKKTN